MDWHEAPKEWEEVQCLDFYGGDLQGIEAKIDYLKSIHVNALFVNPIFYAASCHKFDCLDYFHVDPHFVGDEVGLEGRLDTFEGCRYPMEWREEHQDLELKQLYTELGHLKQSESVLHTGGFRIFETEGKVFAYARFNHAEIMIGVINMEDKDMTVELDLSAVAGDNVDPLPCTDLFGQSIFMKTKSSYGLLVMQLKAKETTLFKI